ncbi:MAG: AAA family ATPase [Paludibacter sp.]|jgi:predicted AAA+ superfamily ATPase|nr:AAA family ATPase [Paludibacter sp.]
MKRKVISELIAWKTDKNRKPLIVNGARQIGKTYIINEFGKHEFKNVVYINFETNATIRGYFDGDISPESLIPLIEAHTGERIRATKTLLFFDEIQACERALTSLKYFCELAPEYHVVSAGSLLGVAVNREKYSFPVGKVDEINMYPFDFEEFLWAMNKEILVEEIKKYYAELKPMPNAWHNMALEMYNLYCIVGGMPAVIADYKANNSFLTIRDMQGKILNEYISDMAKYATPATSMKIRGCYDSIPAQLGKENKKFQYKVVQKGGTATIFGEAIEWLLYAGIVHKCSRLEHGFMPLKVYQNLSDFKLYMSDTGMLAMHTGIATQIILSSLDVDNIFLGALAENFVAQTFAAKKTPLFYWKSEDTAEIDFVLQHETEIIPVEVKKGKRTRSRSLDIFVKKYKSPYAIRISQKNFGFENNIKSVPLYAVFCI